MKKLLVSSITALAFASSTQAATVLFDLKGTGGDGLRSTSEPSVPFPSNATGGEIGDGITFDDMTNLLTLKVGWGSSQGFTDLSSLASNSHIHGPTGNPNGNDGLGDFRQTAVVQFSLTRSSSAVTGGMFTNPPILLNATQALDLLNGKYYINIHTTNNGGGELRGFLVAVPEPSGAGLAALGAGVMLLRRRRRN